MIISLSSEELCNDLMIVLLASGVIVDSALWLIVALTAVTVGFSVDFLADFLKKLSKS